jgi:hypothetical protein
MFTFECVVVLIKLKQGRNSMDMAIIVFIKPWNSYCAFVAPKIVGVMVVFFKASILYTHALEPPFLSKSLFENFVKDSSILPNDVAWCCWKMQASSSFSWCWCYCSWSFNEGCAKFSTMFIDSIIDARLMTIGILGMFT